MRRLVRAIAIGHGIDGEAELAFGQSFVLYGWTRLGWEGAVDLRPRNRDGESQVDCLTTLYLGWKY
jgi:hypothetical protein